MIHADRYIGSVHKAATINKHANVFNDVSNNETNHKEDKHATNAINHGAMNQSEDQWWKHMQDNNHDHRHSAGKNLQDAGHRIHGNQGTKQEIDCSVVLCPDVVSIVQ